MSKPTTESVASLVEQLLKSAEAHDRVALAEDNEYPEPDDWCPHKGGDGSRSVAALLREAASRLSAPKGRSEKIMREAGYGSDALAAARDVDAMTIKSSAPAATPAQDRVLVPREWLKATNWHDKFLAGEEVLPLDDQLVAYLIAEIQVRRGEVSAAERPAPTWQPIESAPTLNVTVLVGIVGGRDMTPAYCHNGDWYCQRTHKRIKPTHWMPLPAAPRPAPGEET